MGNYIDLTGMKFNRLTVIGTNGDTDSNGGILWYCICECGNVTIASGSKLRLGRKKSCGCLVKDTSRESIKKLNQKPCVYDLTTYNYGVGYDYKGNKFLFDKEDYNLIIKYCWHINHKGYMITRPNNKNVLLHRLVVNCPENMVVDHINHDKTDNRKENLRICTTLENNSNQKTYSTNTSGVSGVTWDKSRNKWKATMKYNYKTYFLGRFDTFDEAVNARKSAEIKYRGDYRYKPERDATLTNDNDKYLKMLEEDKK